MPKVTQAHRDRQTRRILVAAEDLFASNGFQATSMDQIINAAGMSSSTVYRYFPGGKQEIIRAVSGVRITPLVEALDAQAHGDTVPDVAETVLAAMRSFSSPSSTRFEDGQDPSGGGGEESVLQTTRLAVNAWAEAARDPYARGVLCEKVGLARARIRELAVRWQHEGVVSEALSPDDVATAALHVAYGVVVERAITGTADVEAAASRLAALLAPRDGSR